MTNASLSPTPINTGYLKEAIARLELKATMREVVETILGHNPPKELVEGILEVLRKDEKLKTKEAEVKESFGLPIGHWKVTTEGDCEGRSTKQLGTFYGHVADIAAHLHNKAFYDLTFTPVEPENIKIEKPAEVREVHIQLNIKSGTWDMKPGEERNSAYRRWLAKQKTKFVKVEVNNSNYYAAVKLKMIPKTKEEIKPDTNGIKRPRRKIIRKEKKK